MQKQILDKDEANMLLNKLITDVNWEEHIKTRDGKCTRLQQYINFCPKNIQEMLLHTLNKIISSSNLGNINVLSIYLNYYRDGKDWCPKHKHEGTKQIVLSLGSARHLYIENKKYKLCPGSVIFFENEYHWMYSENNVQNPRISIVFFYQ